MGELSVPFINGTANFTDLAISHNGTGYELSYHVTYPKNVTFTLRHGDITIKERDLDFVFESNITTVYEGNINSISLVDYILQRHNLDQFH